jgi:hypothetical protein
MIGTTRSRVSFLMNKFRELGIIDYNDGIEVHSSLLTWFSTINRRLGAEAFDDLESGDCHHARSKV